MDLGGGGWSLLLFFFANLGKAAAFERALPAIDFVKHQSKRVDVAPNGSAMTQELFRRHISRSAKNFKRLRLIVDGNGQTKIRNSDAAMSVDHDVRGLQVSMEHAALVGGSQTGHQLARNF